MSLFCFTFSSSFLCIHYRLLNSFPWYSFLYSFLIPSFYILLDLPFGCYIALSFHILFFEYHHLSCPSIILFFMGSIFICFQYVTYFILFPSCFILYLSQQPHFHHIYSSFMFFSENVFCWISLLWFDDLIYLIFIERLFFVDNVVICFLYYKHIEITSLL